MQKAAAWDRSGAVGRRVAALSEDHPSLLVVLELLSMMFLVAKAKMEFENEVREDLGGGQAARHEAERSRAVSNFTLSSAANKDAEGACATRK